MKKIFLATLLSFITAFSAFGTGCDKEEKNELIWTGYEEKVEAYVADIYYCEFPTVQDTLGNTYEVFATVKDETGQEVDSLGGFFLVEKEEEYKIIYSVDDGIATHSKITTLLGIEKAKYGLNDASNIIFSVNEKIDLSSMVYSSKQGEIAFSVRKGTEMVALEGDTFTPTQVGVYTVEAKMEKQPSFSFELFVVEKSARPYADGMVLDGTSAQDIQVNTSFEDYSATISFDETKKYDAKSNGSYKIKASTIGKLKESKTLSFNLSPAYNLEYYKKLESDGYEYIAIRYMVEKNDTTGTARLIYANGTEAGKVAMYYDGRKVKDLSEATSIWNDDFKRVPVGEWAEMLLDIKTFTSSYGEKDIALFKLSVNGEGKNSQTNEPIEGSSWDLTMYIDNIYAVKGEANTEEIQAVDKGTQIDLSNMDVDKVYFNGQKTPIIENKLSVDKYGLYEIVTIDRTVYGETKKPVMVKGSVVSFETASFSAEHKTVASTYKNFIVSETEGKITLASNEASTTTSVFSATYSIQPLGDIEYYKSLKQAGKNYITYTYTLSYVGDMISPYPAGDSETKIQRNALTSNSYQHYNTVGLPESDKQIKAYSYYYTNASGMVLNTANKASGKYFVELVGADCKDNGAWKEYTISISIDDFISLYNAEKMNILSLGFTYKTKEMIYYSVTFGKMQATTQPCVFEA